MRRALLVLLALVAATVAWRTWRSRDVAAVPRERAEDVFEDAVWRPHEASFAQAAEALQAARRRGATDLTTTVRLGMSLAFAGRGDLARGHLEDVQQRAPGHPALRLVQGWTAARRGATDDAMDVLEGVVVDVAAWEPGAPLRKEIGYLALWWCGEQYLDGGYLTAAGDALGRALNAVETEGPPPPSIVAALASAHKQMNNDDAAIEVLQRGIKALPGYAPFRFQLGLLHGKAADSAAARAAFEEAVRLDPRNPTAYLKLAAMAGRDGDLVRMASMLEHAERVAEETAEATPEHGREFLRAELDAARAQLAKERALALVAAGDEDAAREQFDVALQHAIRAIRRGTGCRRVHAVVVAASKWIEVSAEAVEESRARLQSGEPLTPLADATRTFC